MEWSILGNAGAFFGFRFLVVAFDCKLGFLLMAAACFYFSYFIWVCSLFFCLFLMILCT